MKKEGIMELRTQLMMIENTPLINTPLWKEKAKRLKELEDRRKRK